MECQALIPAVPEARRPNGWLNVYLEPFTRTESYAYRSRRRANHSWEELEEGQDDLRKYRLTSIGSVFIGE
jgi:hypothetical protein